MIYREWTEQNEGENNGKIGENKNKMCGSLFY
jgi:hypothetical protein